MLTTVDIHPGLFENQKLGEYDLHLATIETNKWLLKNLKITENSKVIDLGCGNGSTLFWLERETKSILHHYLLKK